MNKEYKCPFCGKIFSGYGNNCSPVITNPNVRCCDACNSKIVIPERLKATIRKQK